MKTVKERTTEDLMELLVQLHTRSCINASSKKLHDAYLEARNEMDNRIGSLQKERDEYREALEWLSHHLRQESVTKDVIRGVLDAALSKNTNK